MNTEIDIHRHTIVPGLTNLPQVITLCVQYRLGTTYSRPGLWELARKLKRCSDG